MTDKLIGNFDKSKSLTVTMPMEEFDKLEKLALSAHTDKLSVEKLQEQLNTAKKALECIINSNDTAFGFVNSNLRRYVEDALAAIGGYDEL